MLINKFVNIIAMEGIKSLNEDLHAAIQVEYKIESWLILDVILVATKSNQTQPSAHTSHKIERLHNKY